MGINDRISGLGSSITVKIAEKYVSLSELKDYNTGTNIDFNKSLDSDVELLLHNKKFGKAQLKVIDNMIYLKVVKIYD